MPLCTILCYSRCAALNISLLDDSEFSITNLGKLTMLLQYRPQRLLTCFPTNCARQNMQAAQVRENGLISAFNINFEKSGTTKLIY